MGKPRLSTALLAVSFAMAVFAGVLAWRGQFCSAVTFIFVGTAILVLGMVKREDGE